MGTTITSMHTVAESFVHHWIRKETKAKPHFVNLDENRRVSAAALVDNQAFDVE